MIVDDKQLALMLLEDEGMKVLIVDDEEVTRKSLKNYVEQMGYSGKTACDGMRALKVLEKERFDVVIIDFNMPKMNGIELLKIVRRSYSKTEAIILTGYADVENAMDAVNYGAYAFFRKPLDTEDFTVTIRQLEKELTSPHKDHATPEQWKNELGKLQKSTIGLRKKVDRFGKETCKKGTNNE